MHNGQLYSLNTFAKTRRPKENVRAAGNEFITVTGIRICPSTLPGSCMYAAAHNKHRGILQKVGRNNSHQILYWPFFSAFHWHTRH